MSAYCAETDLQDLISSSGETLRIDDYSAGANQTALIARIIAKASAQVDLYLLKRYTAATLTASDWVKYATADLAMCILCRRRGNPVPEVFNAQCTTVMEQLQQIMDGLLALPGASERKDSVPVLSNVRTRLDPFPRTVVERSRSTGTPAGYAQATDRTDIALPY
jgi:phage gp36-like protein